MPIQPESKESGDPEVAVIATHSITVPYETARSLEEMIHDASTAVLESAGMNIREIDSVVLSGNDEIDGRVISIMPSTGPAGGVNKDTTMIASSGDHALIYGYLRLKAGQGRNVLVIGWAKPSESVDPDRAELMAAEPYVLRPIGMNNSIAAGLQASRWADTGGTTESEKTATWPLSKDDLPARGDSVHAAVLATEGEFAPGSELAWVVGTGWTTLSYELGGRNIEDLESLRLATAQMSSRSSTVLSEDWDAVEIGGDSEHVVREAARLLNLKSGAVVNGSGALSEKLTSPHVTGLGRMLAAAEELGKANLDETAKRFSAGIGFNGFASQGAAVMVFGSSKGNAA